LIETEYLPPGHPPVFDMEIDGPTRSKAQWAGAPPRIRAIPARPGRPGHTVGHADWEGVDMKRISVDIGGTFTDCFFAWDGDYIQAKALTTHHNLAQGFNESPSTTPATSSG